MTGKNADNGKTSSSLESPCAVLVRASLAGIEGDFTHARGATGQIYVRRILVIGLSKEVAHHMLKEVNYLLNDPEIGEIDPSLPLDIFGQTIERDAVVYRTRGEVGIYGVAPLDELYERVASELQFNSDAPMIPEYRNNLIGLLVQLDEMRA